ncbi:RNA polymerase II transcription elongation factor-domain-containing protein [Lasiosphaeria miniovina]|uniref:RNA polymerase II transcription elongation factor-domain-containing protein n=1 Tax=Lasiosphaeria miniovina TaxID=1954250 RepID=A0AA40BGB0_9PEZI|nr:RNA polymerase II transcription elongation factor-domain-containing protein [Lasiosphaeria miniovina]KAK0733661.1 RNA polymerase II transcription elongation factor-domain-containing protein [Lasiosphaeria miniovina]
MADPGVIDPTKAGKYPIILSDALLGKPSKETYTGVRYNHRPALSSDSAPTTSRLKKSAKEGQFNLSFDDQGNKYLYNGSRTTEDDKYVLIFDPDRQAMILHRVDSVFHMNLTRTPTDTSAESLRKQFPHLEVSSTATATSSSKQQKEKAAEKARPGKTTAAKGKDTGSVKDTAKAKAKPEKAKPEKTKPEKAKPEKAKPEKSKPITLALPTSKPKPPPPPPALAVPEKKPKRRQRSPVESEDDDDDDDGGLTIEYPGGNPATTFQPTNSFSPGFPPFSSASRQLSDFGRGGHDEDDEDADAEFDEEMGEDDDAAFKLPSPVNNPSNSSAAAAHQPADLEPFRYTFDDNDGDDDAEADSAMDADADADALGEDFDAVVAELEKEFHKASHDNGQDSDSSVSEEE